MLTEAALIGKDMLKRTGIFLKSKSTVQYNTLRCPATVYFPVPLATVIATLVTLDSVIVMCSESKHTIATVPSASQIPRNKRVQPSNTNCMNEKGIGMIKGHRDVYPNPASLRKLAFHRSTLASWQ